MRYVEKKGLRIPLFSLGTVQLGMNYGIVGKTEQPSEKEAHKILDAALENGVTMLDTANNYGDSDRVIGSWLKTLTAERPLIVTKIAPFDHSSEEVLREDIRRQAREAVRTLGLDSVDVMMVHNCSDFVKDPEIIREEIFRIKEAGIAKLTAISVYSEDDYFAIARAGFDAIQIPLNIFDQRRIHDGSIKALTDAGMIIFTRSVFLQGLVFMDPDQLSPKMEFLRDTLLKFRALASELSMSPAELALSFVLSVDGVSSTVLGCQTPEQIAANAAMIDRTRQLTDAEMARIYETFRNVSEDIIDPRRWPN